MSVKKTKNMPKNAKKKPPAKAAKSAKKKTPTKAPKNIKKKAAKKAPKATATKAPKQAKKAAKKASARVLATTAAPQKPLRATPVAPTKSMENTAAPHFNLLGDDDQQHTLLQARGKPVVVYFYPRDDTPGCTVQACDFRDNMNRVASKGAVVYGISKDDVASHKKFKHKYGLNFTLLSDPQLSAHRAYQAWGEKMMYGTPTVGVIRSTYLIDASGVVRRAWSRVKVEGHVDAVLEALDAL